MFETKRRDRSPRLRFLIAAWVAFGICSASVISPVEAYESTPAKDSPAVVEGGTEAEHAGDHHGEAKGPMTAGQNDVDLMLWSLVTFVVFVFVLRKLAWGPLMEGLEKRESGVLQNIADAESARIKAEKMLAAHAEKLDKVEVEIRELLAEARRDAEHAKADIVAAAQKEAEATRQRAVEDIGRARDQALDDLFAHMGHAVRMATEQVVGRSLTGADHERLINEALSSVTPSRN